MDELRAVEKLGNIIQDLLYLGCTENKYREKLLEVSRELDELAAAWELDILLERGLTTTR